MGSRSLACALAQHRQAEPKATRRRPWTFDRAGPQLLCVACENTGLLQGGVLYVVYEDFELPAKTDLERYKSRHQTM